MNGSERFTITHHATDEIESRLIQFERDRRCGQVDLCNYAPAKGDDSYGAVMTELARIDLEYAFDNGDPVNASRYIDVYSDVFANQFHRTQIAFEEYRLRRRRGQDLNTAEIAAKYGVDASNWQHVEPEPSQVQAKANSVAPSVRYPIVGDTIAGYLLIQRLGEGAFSRVFLAREPDLVSRLVVVKVTPFSTEESDQLAQLQHTNIIPIYSIHYDRDLTCICMPFLGSTTLADVCFNSNRWTSLHGSAQKLVSTIANRRRWTVHGLASKVQGNESQAFSTNSKRDARSQIQDETFGEIDSEHKNVPNLSHLECLGYVDAFLALIVGAIEGLAHAHERGVIHRDLKPANILVTDDGRAVLLDFNLAVSALDEKTRIVGGTLPYISPQQLEAVETSTRADARDDVFSIGVILYELLSGIQPFPGPVTGERLNLQKLVAERQRPPAPLRSLNDRVSFGLSAIIQKCLAPDREGRYRNGGELLEDLMKHRDRLPLIHAANASWRESIGNWAARHPKIASASTVASVACIVLLFSTVLIWQRGERIKRLNAEAKYGQLESEYPGIVMSLSTPGREPSILQDGLRRSSTLMSHWGAGIRAIQENADIDRLNEGHQQTIAKRLARLAYLNAEAEADTSSYSASADDDQQNTPALLWNQRAVELNPSLEPLVEYQRHRIMTRFGQADVPQPPPLDLSSISNPELGVLAAAEAGDSIALRQFCHSQLETQPTDAIAWFNLATANWHLGKLDDAIAGYSLCDRMHPRRFVTLFNRGVCNLERGEFKKGVDDFTVCLELSPESMLAKFNRAVAYHELKDYESSIADLDRVISMGNPTTRMVLMRGQVHDAMGNSKQVLADRQMASLIAPRDANDWVALGVSRLERSPEQAVRDFQAALHIDSGHVSALQNTAHVYAERLQKPSAAIAMLGRLVALRPGSASPLASRGIVLARTGNYQGALSDAKAAAARSPSALEKLQIAGVYALIDDHLSDSAELSKVESRAASLRWLARALRSDPKLSAIAAGDQDLVGLRDDDTFRRLVGSGMFLYSNSQSSN